MTRLHPEHITAGLVPLDQDPDISRTARTPVADALWYLVRQAEMGEFAAQDRGTPALLRLEGSSNTFTATRNGPDDPALAYDPRIMPLEMRVGRTDERRLRDWDHRRLSLGREIGRLLREAGVAPAARRALADRFALKDAPDPRVGQAAEAVTLHRGGRGMDGVALLDLARNAPIDTVLEAAGVPPGDPAIAVVQAGLIALLNEDAGAELGDETWRDGTLTHSAEVLAPTGSAAPLTLSNPAVLRGGTITEVELFDGVILPGAGALSGVDLGALVAAQGSTLPDVAHLMISAQASDAPHDILRIAGHTGGPLDWWSFDAVPGTERLGAQAGRPAPPFVDTVIPAPVRFPGMPLARLWSVEPPGSNYGHLDPEPEDLARLIVAEFALGGARDWMTAPIGVLAGSITHLDTVVLRDSFGRDRVARPAAASDDPFWFCVTAMTDGTGASSALVVPPVMPHHLRGPATERVDLMRDPSANLVWAVEARAPDAATGISVDRTEQVLAAPPAPQPRRRATEAQMAYRVATDVPANRFPFEMPVNADHRILVRARLLDTTRLTADAPSGDILAAPAPIHDEAVPPTGVRLEQAHLRVRWTGGGVRSWSSRETRPEKPKVGSSGLRYDTISPVGPTATFTPVEGGRLSLRDVASYAGSPSSMAQLISPRAPSGSLRDAITRLASDLDGAD